MTKLYRVIGLNHRHETEVDVLFPTKPEALKHHTQSVREGLDTTTSEVVTDSTLGRRELITRLYNKNASPFSSTKVIKKAEGAKGAREKMIRAEQRASAAAA